MIVVPQDLRTRNNRVAIVYIPSLMQPLTGGLSKVDVVGSSVRQIIDGREAMYPGVKERLIEDHNIRPGLSVIVDGEISPLGTLEKVAEQSEVHFLPAIGGG